MNKLSNWLFHWWYAKKLQEQRSSPFKMKMETDSLKSNCILEIENEIEPLWLSIKNILYKLGIKTTQNNRTRLHRDDFGKESISPDPVFTENQIAEIKSKIWQYLAITLGFCTAESFLYSLTASLFVPGGRLLMQIPVAIFLAVLIMLGLDYAFEQHFLYREAIERHGKKELNDTQMHKYRDMRNIGYAIIVLSFAAIIFSGLARIFFLEYIPTNGLSPKRIVSITQASKMSSIFTMLVTIIAALLLAMIKRDHKKISIRFRIFKSWHTAHVRRNEYTQSLIRNANRIQLATEQSIEKHWQLVIDLKRVYKMKNEYDQKYEPLHEEYVLKKGKPGFALNDDLYGKFSPIQCAYEELFKYGVMNAKEIKDKIAFASDILKVPADHLAEHLGIVPDHKDEDTVQTFILPSTNGNAKKHEFLTH